MYTFVLLVIPNETKWTCLERNAKLNRVKMETKFENGRFTIFMDGDQIGTGLGPKRAMAKKHAAEAAVTNLLLLYPSVHANNDAKVTYTAIRTTEAEESFLNFVIREFTTFYNNPTFDQMIVMTYNDDEIETVRRAAFEYGYHTYVHDGYVLVKRALDVIQLYKYLMQNGSVGKYYVVSRQ